MEKINKTDEKIVFKSDVGESLMNAIRRYVHQIPMVAIDEVEIERNDSPLYDETIAHRVGLIPLRQGSKKSGSLKLSSKKEGFVYSGEMEGDFKVVYDKIPITLIKKGQEIKFKANVKVGTGSEHAKFSPGLMNYRNVVEIELDKETAEKVKGIIPGLDFDVKGSKVKVVDDKEKEVGDVIEGICEKEGKEISIKDSGELIVSVESFGQIKPEDIFKKSVETLRKDLDDFAKKIK